jgi:hypothetical protein
VLSAHSGTCQLHWRCCAGQQLPHMHTQSMWRRLSGHAHKPDRGGHPACCAAVPSPALSMLCASSHTRQRRWLCLYLAPTSLSHRTHTCTLSRDGEQDTHAQTETTQTSLWEQHHRHSPRCPCIQPKWKCPGCTTTTPNTTTTTIDTCCCEAVTLPAMPCVVSTHARPVQRPTARLRVSAFKGPCAPSCMPTAAVEQTTLPQPTLCLGIQGLQHGQHAAVAAVEAGEGAGWHGCACQLAARDPITSTLQTGWWYMRLHMMNRGHGGWRQQL